MSKLHLSVQLKNRLLDYWRDDRKYFIGRILTIIDASISDQEQRKGIKDLIHSVYCEKNYRENGFKEVLLDWIKNFAPTQLPKTDDERDRFVGIYKSTDRPTPEEYWSK
uniref:Uncharacterized protein n=1 Tax=viral metagenome TaxID=1070528 RepID=A0A6H1ZKB4_9ZZZZ